MKVSIDIDVDFDKIANLLCSAFESGYLNWARIEDYIEPNNVWHWNFLDDFNDGRVYEYVQYPLSEGGAVILKCDGYDKTFTLDLASIKSGLAAMAKSCNRFSDIINDEIDAETGELFINYCLFGEVVFA